MELREQRGIVLAAMAKICLYGDRWKVPSQSGPGFYMVTLGQEHSRCSCPDWETRRQNCKHIYAAQFVRNREQSVDGSTTVTESVMPATAKQTYPQSWPAYNEAQTKEQDKFQALLHDLCSGLVTVSPKFGRPRLPLSDALFNVTFKVYSTVSQRRFLSDLREAYRRGYISKVPHFNSISNYLESPELTPILRDFITKSSLPLRAVESDFAVDSSGFTTCRYARWFDLKYGKEMTREEWVKCHVMCGVKTNIVTAVEIGDKHASDVKFFSPLVETTSRNFMIAEVSADKAYGSLLTTDAVHKAGGTPFMSFRGNATGNIGGTYQAMFHYFMFRRDEFLQHYHKRSNIESTFSMIKRKFGDSLRSKTDVAMVNETLCKILCHNLVVLIHEMYELGVDPEFWAKKETIN